MVAKVKETKINLPWLEKYRPSKLEDVVSQQGIIKTINKFIEADQLPHLLFYGPPGTGKTTTILACAKQLYAPSQFQSMVLELNASDDRGIGVVRGQILTFASTRTMFNKGFKLIILDEADSMTMDAQNALRRSDLEHKRSVTKDKIQTFARLNNINDFITSARSGENVTSALMELIALHVGIPLSKSEQDHQKTIVKAELIPSVPDVLPANISNSGHSSICEIQ